MSSSQRRVLLAKPRGYCAGVDRAVQAVEMALDRFGPPVYVRRQIVHNTYVVSTLERRGAVFVSEVDEVPPGAVVVFSAHGIAPEVRLDAERRGLRAIDATCPLVTKVHNEARRFAARDYDILLGGHAGHEEGVGAAGGAPAPGPLGDGVDDAGEVDERWLDGVTTVGVTSGASVPEELVSAVLDTLAGHGFGSVEEVEAVEEHMTFALPRELRPAGAAGSGFRRDG